MNRQGVKRRIRDGVQKGCVFGCYKEKREKECVCVSVVHCVVMFEARERQRERESVCVCEIVCVCVCVFARGLYAFIFLSTQEFSFVNVRRNIILEFLSVLNFQLFCMILHMLSVIGDP